MFLKILKSKIICFISETVMMITIIVESILNFDQDFII